MNPKQWGVVVMILSQAVSVSGAWATYETLLHRYEHQIQEQERQLSTLRSNLIEKEHEAARWQEKAEQSKIQWKTTGGLLVKVQKTLQSVREQWGKTRILVQAAQWAVAEKKFIRETSQREMGRLSVALYKDWVTETATRQPQLGPAPVPFVLTRLTDVSQAAQMGLQEARRQELEWRQKEDQWRQQEMRYRKASESYRAQQWSHWSRWQQALHRKQSLEEERNQMEQSAQAMRVMLDALRSHRDQTRDVLHEEQSAWAPVPLRNIPWAKASLPWPVRGRVLQTFGRHYSEDLHQLQISNGIKIQGDPGRPVRCIQAGKVLYARPFQHYGQLVIVRHAKNMTSVYGSLAQTDVNEGQSLAALDVLGTLDATGSFYFEMRHQEQPIDPQVWLTPALNSEHSSRRTSP